MALHYKDFKNKPGIRDKDLLSIEVTKELFHRQSSSLSSQMERGLLFASNKGFYTFELANYIGRSLLFNFGFIIHIGDLVLPLS